MLQLNFIYLYLQFQALLLPSRKKIHTVQWILLSRPAQYFSLISVFITLPELVRGRAFTKSTEVGFL